MKKVKKYGENRKNNKRNLILWRFILMNRNFVWQIPGKQGSIELLTPISLTSYKKLKYTIASSIKWINKQYQKIQLLFELLHG